MTERPILFSAPMVRALRENRKTQTRRTRGLDKINAEPDAWEFRGFDESDGLWVWASRNSSDMYMICCPYGVAGDRLWTRETFQPLYAEGKSHIDTDWKTGKGYAVSYPATDAIEEFYNEATDEAFCNHCKPSIHMPRWASRDNLEVINSRPERLQAITEADAKAEGCESTEITSAEVADFLISDNPPQLKNLSRKLGPGTFTAKFDYMMLWDEINGKTISADRVLKMQQSGKRIPPDVSWFKNPWVWRVEFWRLAS